MEFKKLFEDVKNGKYNKNVVLVFEDPYWYWSCDDRNLTKEEQQKLVDKYLSKYGIPDETENEIRRMFRAAGVSCERRY